MRYPTLSRLFLVAHQFTGGNKPRVSALCLACLLLACIGRAGSAESFSVNATRLDDAVEIKTRATIKAPLSLIWNTLTDYDHLSDFIPGINTSRVIGKQGKTSIVEQTGYARVWFFKIPVHVTVEAVEKPPYEIQLRLLKGNLKRLEGSYLLEKIGNDDTYTLRWSGIIEPKISISDAITMSLMRKNISEQFLGMVNEIERRAALRSRNQPQ
jgi:ribosome-associated toxin RatA of RatAB toxin-antitoxin module